MKMRKWLKKLFKEIMLEIFEPNEILQSSRAPTENDLRPVGATWKHGDDVYVARGLKAEWEKQ